MNRKKRASHVAIIATQLGLGTVFVVPLVWMVLAAFKPEASIFRELCYLEGFSFTNFTLENFTIMFKRSNMNRYILNSIIYISIVLGIGLVINSMAGYALAKLRFPGRKTVLSLIIALYIVPFESVLLPLYLQCTSIDLVNNLWSLAIPFAADCFSIFLFRQFFMSLPDSLVEATHIEGAGNFKIFSRIALPNAKPVFATATVLIVVKHWGGFLWPLISIVNQDLRNVQLGITAYFADQPIMYGPIMAGLTYSTIPMVVIFLLLQKYYVQGIVSTGIKA